MISTAPEVEAAPEVEECGRKIVVCRFSDRFTLIDTDGTITSLTGDEASMLAEDLARVMGEGTR